jgi:hypothetical protein
MAIRRIPYYGYLIAPSIMFAAWNVVYLEEAHQTGALVSELVKMVLLCAAICWIVTKTPSLNRTQWTMSLQRLAINSLLAISFLSDLTALQVFWRIPPEVARNYQHHLLAVRPDDTTKHAAEKVGILQERRTSGAKAQRILNRLRHD